jgi:hypothetical protein
MLIWGGRSAEQPANGALYNPETDSWRPIDVGSHTHSNAGVGWTGDELFVWGGQGPESELLHNGFLYNPETGAWRELNDGGPAALLPAVVVVANTVVLTGGNIEVPAADRYDQRTEEWTPVAERGLVDGVGVPSAIKFSHGDDEAYFCRENGECGVYSVASDSWQAFELPESAWRFRSAWVATEDALVIFAGADDTHANEAGGSRFLFATGEWRNLPSDGQPSARAGASLTALGEGSWFLWGGQSDTSDLNQEGYVLTLQ